MTGKGVPGCYEDAGVEDYTGGGSAHGNNDCLDDEETHLDPGITGSDGFTPCLKCHPSDSHIAVSTDTVIDAQDRVDGDIDVIIPSTYYAKNGNAGTVIYNGNGGGIPVGSSFCADVSCHGGQNSPVWTASLDPDTECTSCHVRDAFAVNARVSASEYQSAFTGLHTVISTSVSSMDHWSGAGCGGAGTCHVGQPTGVHFGTNLDDPDLIELTNANANMQAGISIVADGNLDDADLDTCAMSCHAEGVAGAPYWVRSNDKAASVVIGAAACLNCHGTFALGWRTNAGDLDRPDMSGVSGPGEMLAAPHDSDWDGDGNSSGSEIVPEHDVCKTCHGMTDQANHDDNYLTTTMWDPTGTTSDHGNGLLNMNGPSADINLANNATPAGAEYNGNDDDDLEKSDYSCTQACHSGANNDDHNMGDSGWPGIYDAPPHVKYDDYGAGACEFCHGCPVDLGCDQAAGGGDDAPNVMGVGTVDQTGVGSPPKPCDNFTYGANVNGHGANGSAPNAIGGFSPDIDRACTDCHSLGATHQDCEVDLAATATKTNPMHLNAGFLGSGSPAEDNQVTFDNFCWLECHDGAPTNPKDMRHAKDNDPAPNAMQFGQHNSYSQPNDTAPPMYWDRIIQYRSGGSENFGTCTSCHNPHGTSVDGSTQRPSDDNNMMVHYPWKKAGPVQGSLCGKCHP
jgi:hypothetical protein